MPPASRKAADASASAPAKTLRTLRVASAAEWETWLAEHHSSSPGVWLKLAKRASGVDSPTYAEALDVALCYGWIDGQKQAHDDNHWLQRFTPRTAKSRWSAINREHVARLIEAGRMKPAGQKAIDAAKADGRWDAAYDSPSRAQVPPDLQSALDANPKAKAFFATIASHNRYAILYRVQDAKKPETRAQRIANFVTMLAKHETLHPEKRDRKAAAKK